MDRERRAVLRSFAQVALAALPAPRLRFDRPPVELQPFAAHARRLVDALAFLGEPFPDAALEPLRRAERAADERGYFTAVEQLFATRCLAEVRINPEGRVSIERGAAEPRLVEHGWRAFLVKVRNESGTTARLAVESPQARPVYRPATGNAMAPPSVSPGDVADRWLAIEMFDGRPLEPQLSGLAVE